MIIVDESENINSGGYVYQACYAYSLCYYIRHGRHECEGCCQRDGVAMRGIESHAVSESVFTRRH